MKYILKLTLSKKTFPKLSKNAFSKFVFKIAFSKKIKPIPLIYSSWHTLESSESSSEGK